MCKTPWVVWNITLILKTSPIDTDQNNEDPNHETSVNVLAITDKSMQNIYGFM